MKDPPRRLVGIHPVADLQEAEPQQPDIDNVSGVRTDFDPVSRLQRSLYEDVDPPGQVLQHIGERDGDTRRKNSEKRTYVGQLLGPDPPLADEHQAHRDVEGHPPGPEGRLDVVQPGYEGTQHHVPQHEDDDGDEEAQAEILGMVRQKLEELVHTPARLTGPGRNGRHVGSGSAGFAKFFEPASPKLTAAAPRGATPDALGLIGFDRVGQALPGDRARRANLYGPR